MTSVTHGVQRPLPDTMLSQSSRLSIKQIVLRNSLTMHDHTARGVVFNGSTVARTVLTPPADIGPRIGTLAHDTIRMI